MAQATALRNEPVQARSSRSPLHRRPIATRRRRILHLSIPDPRPADAAPDHGLTSIVIVTYNEVEFTRQCLDSIRLLTDEPYELIVVDNGSTDGTADLFQTLPDVRLI